MSRGWPGLLQRVFPSFARKQIIKAPRIIPSAEHRIDVQHLCPSATEVVRQLQDRGHEAYIVGGSVRDLLLGKVPKDFDVATSATPEEVKARFPRSRLIGRRFRLAHVRLNGVLVEVATFRGQSGEGEGERHAQHGRILRDNVWGSVEEDAVRRDFTINALFLDPVSGEIRDFVNGYQDLKEQRLRLIGDPETRYREDPVRLLRAARFVAKLGVKMDPATLAPVAKITPMIEHVPPARLFEETSKLFLTGHGAETMRALVDLGLVQALFPALDSTDAPGWGLLRQALINTDERIRIGKSVTPAFLFAALLWPVVRARSQELQAAGSTDFQALELAGDEAIAQEVHRVAIPRRFSSVTRQIWLTQARLQRTKGRRALAILQQPRFRAAYDFLLLRAHEEPEHQQLADFWTEAQRGGGQAVPDAPQSDPNGGAERRRRPRRRRRKSAANA